MNVLVAVYTIFKTQSIVDYLLSPPSGDTEYWQVVRYRKFIQKIILKT